jgi:N-acetylmuramic acid 6-phosphate etherase
MDANERVDPERADGRRYVGVDGGGTKTYAVVTDETFRVLGEGRSGPSNSLSVGVDAAVRAVEEAVRLACHAAGVSPDDVDALGVALAGVRNPANHARTLEPLRARFPRRPLILVEDARAALAGATDLGPGVVVVAGTGSIAFGLSAGGQTAWSGGWGPTVDDEGSGFDIGRRALRAVVGEADGRGPRTSLTARVCQKFGVPAPEDLPAVIYERDRNRHREIAALARLVVEEAAAGDGVARAILERAGQELGETVTAVVKTLGLEGEAFPVAYVGGVFRAGAFVLDALRAAVTAVAPGARLVEPLFDPAVGAAKLGAAARESAPHESPAPAAPRPPPESVTEAVNPRTAGLDRMSTIEAARAMNAEDRGVAEAVGGVLPAVAAAVDVIAERLRAGGRLFYVGTGTSGRLGVLDASECPPTFGVPPDLVQGIIAGGYEACYRPVEASEDDAAQAARDMEARGVGAGDVVVGLTAGGSTPYTLAAVRWARARGAATVAVTCNRETPIEREADIAIVPAVGPEAVAGSTRLKAGTAQKLVLNMLSTLAMVRLGLVLGNRMSNIRASNRKLAARAEAILREACGLDEAGARKLLQSAGGELATALLMAKAGVTAEEARARLQQAGGSVWAAAGGEPTG